MQVQRPHPRYLPNTAIEIIRDLDLAHPPQHVLFDFDGTLSLIREGWVDVMVPMMVDVLTETGTKGPIGRLTKFVADYVMELNGRQTIYQMIRLAEEVAKRGGRAKAPLEYKHDYHELLMKRIHSRREALRAQTIPADEMLVPGSLQMLEALKEKGAKLYLASGTDEKYVREEVALLELELYFGEHVYGAVDDYESYSKAQIIQRILNQNERAGGRLLGFGDGYVEIENVKAVGGTAIAVASDERNRSGKPDEWKRQRLIAAGADFVVPDYREYGRLIEYLWST